MITIDHTSKLVLFNLNHSGYRLNHTIKVAWEEVAKDLVATAIALIENPPKTGVIYKRKLRGNIVRHQASAPGEAPANFTGVLKSNIRTKLGSPNQFKFGVTDNVGYGKFLEEGTKFMGARPFLALSITENVRNMRNHIERGIRQAYGLR